jgi:release factor glutamine methyltransferase
MTTLSVRDALSFAKTALANSPTPRLDSEILLAFVIQQQRIFLITHPEYRLTASEESQFKEMLNQRSLGSPIAYLTGQREFWSLNSKTRNRIMRRSST